MRLAYVAGPFSAPDRKGVEANIAAAVDVGLRVVALGYLPVIPHSMTGDARFSELQPYTFWIEGTLELLKRCDLCVMVPGWEHSSGARGERIWAIENGMPVYDSVTDLEVLLNG